MRRHSGDVLDFAAPGALNVCESKRIFISMTSISAIVPTYNRAGYLTQAVEALRAQTRKPDEIIVWDDGSTDGTEAAARKMGKAIRYFRSENGGKSRALNAAMREARGDLIWICDDDDLALPDAAETLAGMLRSAPRGGDCRGLLSAVPGRAGRPSRGTGTRLLARSRLGISNPASAGGYLSLSECDTCQARAL